MAGVLDNLKEMGCDIDGAMPRFLNNEDFYIKCLRKFVDDSLFDNLVGTLSANEVEESFKHAHNLKGVCANLGITPMQNIIYDMVEVLRMGDIPVDGLDKMKRVIAIKEEIKSYLS